MDALPGQHERTCPVFWQTCACFRVLSSGIIDFRVLNKAESGRVELIDSFSGKFSQGRSVGGATLTNFAIGIKRCQFTRKKSNMWLISIMLPSNRDLLLFFSATIPQPGQRDGDLTWKCWKLTYVDNRKDPKQAKTAWNPWKRKRMLLRFYF